MPATVEKLPDEPIIRVTIKGQLTVEDARRVYAQIAEIAETIEGRIFRITDVREQETTFAEMMAVIKEASKDMPGTTSDPRISNMFVGREKMALLARDMMSSPQHGGVKMPVFESMDDALTAIRLQLVEEKNG